MKPLHIVVVTDNHYIILLAALIKSVEENIRPSQRIIFHVIEDNIGKVLKQKLEGSVQPEITSLEWIPMKQLIPAGIKLPLDRTSFPLNIYMRFFIPYLFNDDTEKVLYLDVDMIVLGDITALFEYEMSDYIIGAVMDPRVKTFNNSWGSIANYAALGLDGNSPYFNSGLLLINVKKWREQDIAKKIIQCIEENIQFANYPDQYGLNVVFANQWLQLDARWNHFASMQAKQPPYLIHFTERKPIYKKNYSGKPEFRELFFKYLNLSLWTNFELINEVSRIRQKLKNVLQKLLKRFRFAC